MYYKLLKKACSFFLITIVYAIKINSSVAVATYLLLSKNSCEFGACRKKKEVVYNEHSYIYQLSDPI